MNFSGDDKQYNNNKGSRSKQQNTSVFAKELWNIFEIGSLRKEVIIIIIIIIIIITTITTTTTITITIITTTTTNNNNKQQ